MPISEVGRIHPGKRSINVGALERMVSAGLGVGLVGWGLRRGGLSGLLLSSAGGAFLYRGLSGHCPFYTALGMNLAAVGEPGITIRQGITILGERRKLFRLWRSFENLPRFMAHVLAVEPLADNRWRWRVKTLLGPQVEWVVALTEDLEGEGLGWATPPGSPVEHQGSVRFRDAPGGRGTEVSVTFHYRAPGGRAGLVLTRLLGEDPHRQVADDLRRLKQLVETGEVATAAPQPSGHRSPLGRALTPHS